jgi:Tol biopolymer transport system component
VIIGYAAPVGGTISPDGGTLAFTASDETGRILLWVRHLHEASVRALSRTEGAALPFWSPDSRSLGFFAGGMLKRIDVVTGTSQDLSTVSRARGGTWNPDGVIVYAEGLETALSRIDATGGKPRPATMRGRSDRSHRFPWFLPDGRRFLFYVEGVTPEATGVFVGNLDGGSPTRLLAADTAAIYAASSRHLLFVRQSTPFAQAFDVDTLRLSNGPFFRWSTVCRTKELPRPSPSPASTRYSRFERKPFPSSSNSPGSIGKATSWTSLAPQAAIAG